jgi:SSS family solute:Na+ symporter
VLPALVFGLFTRWFHRWALLAGWAVGMALSLWMLWSIPKPGVPGSHFGGSLFALSHLGLDTEASIWTGILGLAVNILVAAALTPLMSRAPRGTDSTDELDYHAEAGDPGVHELSLDAPTG